MKPIFSNTFLHVCQHPSGSPCRVTLWLTDILSGSSSFALEPESQLHGQESGVIDQVRFQVSQCEVISKSDYEIGGRKHVPKQKRLDIGRLVTRSNVKSSTGDGVGIGGGHDTKFDRCKIQLSWQSKVGHSGWPLTHHQAWFLAVRSAVHKRAQVVIDSVLLDGEIYELNGSLARFFALLQRGGLPMTRVSSLNHPEAQSLTELQAVVEEVKVSLTAIESPWAQLSAGKPLLRVLWQDLLEVVAKVEGGHYQMICSSRLTQMIHSKAWSSLYLSPTINIDHVIGLKADLNKLRNTLDLLTITRGCQ